eukprot:3845305-Rhodomonas_salina.2
MLCCSILLLPSALRRYTVCGLLWNPSALASLSFSPSPRNTVHAPHRHPLSRARETSDVSESGENAQNRTANSQCPAVDLHGRDSRRSAAAKLPSGGWEERSPGVFTRVQWVWVVCSTHEYGVLHTRVRCAVSAVCAMYCTVHTRVQLQCTALAQHCTRVHLGCTA